MGNPLKGLRAALDVIAECPDCGGRRLVMATSWRGHGTGHNGSSQYEATGFEKTNPNDFCVCVGGPVWQEIQFTEFGQSLNMARAAEVWRATLESVRQGKVFFIAEEDHQTYTLEIEKWRKALIENWENIINNKPLEG